MRIEKPLAIVDRDLADAGGGISPDWRFGIAYNAVPKSSKFKVQSSRLTAGNFS